MVPPTTAPTLDPNAPRAARSPRSERTRASVVDALLDLLREGNLRPTAKEIAERAGTSLRSVYVHFDDLEDLFTAAAGRAIQQISTLMEPIPASGPVETRIDAFVSQRMRVFEGMGDVRRAATLQAPFSPSLAALLARGGRNARQQVKTVFAPELEQFDGAERKAVIAAIDALSSGAAWDHWRHDHGYDANTASAAMKVGLLRILVPR